MNHRAKRINTYDNTCKYRNTASRYGRVTRASAYEHRESRFNAAITDPSERPWISASYEVVVTDLP